MYTPPGACHSLCIRIASGSTLRLCKPACLPVIAPPGVHSSRHHRGRRSATTSCTPFNTPHPYYPPCAPQWYTHPRIPGTCSAPTHVHPPSPTTTTPLTPPTSLQPRGPLPAPVHDDLLGPEQEHGRLALDQQLLRGLRREGEGVGGVRGSPCESLFLGSVFLSV